MKATENEFIQYDVRLVKHHFNRGKLGKKEYEQYLRTLEDVSEESEVIPREALFDLPETDDNNPDEETTTETND